MKPLPLPSRWPKVWQNYRQLPWSKSRKWHYWPKMCRSMPDLAWNVSLSRCCFLQKTRKKACRPLLKNVNRIIRDDKHEHSNSENRYYWCRHHGCRHCPRSEEHTSELQSRENLVCRLLLEKKKNKH